MTRWFIFISIYLIIDIYAFQAFKTIFNTKWILFFYWVISFFSLFYFSYQLAIVFDRKVGLTLSTNQAIGIFLLVLIPKIVLVLFMFSEDIIRLLQGIFRQITQNKTRNNSFFVSRRKFMSQIALAVATIPFGGMLYGIFKGKYNYKVLKYTLEFNPNYALELSIPCLNYCKICHFAKFSVLTVTVLR